jgi:hypothetical protein
MTKIKQDEEYQEYLKNYAALLAIYNPKPQGKALEELRKRIEARQVNQTLKG